MESSVSGILIEIAKQIPSLAVLCFIVWATIQYNQKRDAAISEVNKQTLTAMGDMHKEHLYARETSREAINDNTRAMRDNSRAIEALKEAIQNKR